MKRSLIRENCERTHSFTKLAVMFKRDRKTVYNWCLKGSHGVLMEYVNMPSGMQSSLEAYSRFIDALNEELL